MTLLVFIKGISEISGEDISYFIYGLSGGMKGGIKSRREMLVDYLQLFCFLAFLDIPVRVARIPISVERK